MLEAEGADFKEVDTHNILADEIMREELKEYSDWPTFPQVLWDLLSHFLSENGSRVIF